MSQPVVNNTYIPVNMNIKFINFLFDNNIVTIGNLIKSDGKVKHLCDIVPPHNSLYKQHYLSWLSLTTSIPKQWLNKIKKGICKTYRKYNIKKCLLLISNKNYRRTICQVKNGK